MQLLIRCNGRIFLAICLILFVGYTAQGAPMQKASDKRVRCQPDAWSTNCIKENQPWFSLPTGGANRILPPDPSPRKTQQDLNVIFPLSDEEPGSGSYAAMAVETGSDAVMAEETASGSGLSDSDSFFPAGLGAGELEQKLTEEDLLL